METRKLSELKATNPYLRLGTDVSELEKSIQTLGLIAPLVISKNNVILAGARRFQALSNLGFTEAPVLVVDRGELENELVSIDENLVRKDLSKIEIEAHLRRAREIYQELHPVIETDSEDASLKSRESDEEAEEDKPEKEILPAQEFLEMVSQKTGLSPRQIHQAIERDEKASVSVKEARKKGKLSLSQTNEIVKLPKEAQDQALEHILDLPVKEIKKFVKEAKTEGVTNAILKSPKDPMKREFFEIETQLKKVAKKLKQLELEGLAASDLPSSMQELLGEISLYYIPGIKSEAKEINSYQ